MMEFGPALSLGVASLAEYADLKLYPGAVVDLASLPATLSEVSIDGVRITAVRALAPSDRPINRVIDQAQYVFALPRSTLEHLGLHDKQAIAARISERRERGDLHVLRKSEGVGRKIDVGRYLLDVRVGEGREALQAAGLVGDLLPITIRMRITDSGTAKATEALEALLGERDLTAWTVRAALLGETELGDVTPMSLEALRLPQRMETPGLPHAPPIATESVSAP
jgi:hypothetical protein